MLRSRYIAVGNTVIAVFGHALKWLSGALCIPLIFGVSSSLALDESSPTQGYLVLEEVIVTARRREEPLQEVPVAATVLSEAELRNHSVQDLFDIQFPVPNLLITCASRKPNPPAGMPWFQSQALT